MESKFLKVGDTLISQSWSGGGIMVTIERVTEKRAFSSNFTFEREIRVRKNFKGEDELERVRQRGPGHVRSWELATPEAVQRFQDAQESTRLSYALRDAPWKTIPLEVKRKITEILEAHKANDKTEGE